MAIVVEELIPVAAIYAPFMLPSTCILPGQLARIEEKKNLKAIASASEAQDILAKIRKSAVDGTLPISALKGTGSAVVVCGCVHITLYIQKFLTSSLDFFAYLHSETTFSEHGVYADILTSYKLMIEC